MGSPKIMVTAWVVGIICCCAAAVSAGNWADTGKPINAYVTDCSARGRDHWCDYHWNVDGGRYAGRLRGKARPDGQVVRLWIDPDDPAHVDADKSVGRAVIWFGLFGLSLLAVAAAFWGAGRPIVVLALIPAGLAVAAAPAGAIVAQSSGRPGVPAVVTSVPLNPALREVVTVDTEVPGGVTSACPRAVDGAEEGRVAIESTNLPADTSTIRLDNGTTERSLLVPGIVYSVALTAEGETLATGDTDGVVRLWDTATKRRTATIIDNGWVNSVAFSRDGRTLAVGGDHVRLWDVATLHATATLRGPNEPYLVAFGPDGHSFSVCDDGGIVRRWTI